MTKTKTIYFDTYQDALNVFKSGKQRLIKIQRPSLWSFDKDRPHGDDTHIFIFLKA